MNYLSWIIPSSALFHQHKFCGRAEQRGEGEGNTSLNHHKHESSRSRSRFVPLERFVQSLFSCCRSITCEQQLSRWRSETLIENRYIVNAVLLNHHQKVVKHFENLEGTLRKFKVFPSCRPALRLLIPGIKFNDFVFSSSFFLKRLRGLFFTTEARMESLRRKRI